MIQWREGFLSAKVMIIIMIIIIGPRSNLYLSLSQDLVMVHKTCPNLFRTWSVCVRKNNFALLFQNSQNAWWNICWMCEHCHIFSLTLNGRNMNFKPAFHSFMEKVAFTKRGGRCPSLYASFTRYFAKFLNIDKKWTSPNPIYHPTTSISHHNLLQMRKSWCVAHSNFYKNYNWSMTRITLLAPKVFLA